MNRYISTFERHDGAVTGKHQVMVLPLINHPDGPPSMPVHRAPDNTSLAINPGHC